MSKHLNPAQKFAIHHSFTIFTVIVAIVLSVTIVMCYLLYSQATSITDEGKSGLTATRFDTATEESLKSLHTRDNANTQLELPEGKRINPFVE